ncbi:MAG: division/cell wall cluster transcriptional repressor MraZ [Chloroflexota bacterium]
MFTGEYRHTVDDKGRLAIPTRLRAQLAEGGQVSAWMDGCVALHPNSEWEKLTAQVESLPFTDTRSRKLRRLLYGSAFEVRLDRQGRFVLPPKLREVADIETEVVLVGAGNRIELWSPERWSEFSEQMDQPEALAESLQGLGI